MNRDIIKANKDAFDKWLKTGRVWIKHGFNSKWSLQDSGWTNKYVKYIANDEYAELAIAQTDGKQIQYYDVYNEWKNIKNLNRALSYDTNFKKYRIKPENTYVKTVSYYNDKRGVTHVTEQVEVSENDFKDAITATGNYMFRKIP